MKYIFTEEEYNIVSKNFSKWRETLKSGDRFLIPFVILPSSLPLVILPSSLPPTQYFWFSTTNHFPLPVDLKPFIAKIKCIDTCHCTNSKNFGCPGLISFLIEEEKYKDYTFNRECLGYDNYTFLVLPVPLRKTLIFREKL